MIEGGGKYKAFTLPNLREKLCKRGAKVSGRKAELVNRFVLILVNSEFYWAL